MSGVVRFGVSMEEPLLSRFDALVERKGYANRSEAVRDLVRQELLAEEWEAQDHPTVATVTLVYDHSRADVGRRLTDMQHDHHEHILSTLHVHLDREHCMEVVVARGTVSELRHLADHLGSMRGVTFSRLVLGTLGAGL